MNSTTHQTKAEELATLLATHEHVVMAKAIGRRVIVEFPRERGGRSSMSLPQAKALVARLGLA